LRIQKSESIALSELQGNRAFENKTFVTVVETIVSTPSVGDKLLEKVVSTVNEQDDVRLYFFRNLT
jgi:hypothetical protein